MPEHLFDRAALVARSTKGLILDVRGTLVDPVEDAPMSAELSALLCRVLKSGVVVALNTATSITSLQTLVLQPLLDVVDCDLSTVEQNLVTYVDSSTAAYVLAAGRIQALPDFEFLHFSETELATSLSVIDQANRKFSLGDPPQKVKNGQVNFYCGGSWDRRLAISRFLNQRLPRRVRAMVPTAKETIDIAVSDKKRGVQDLIRRFHLSGQDLVAVGDSMQEGAPDLDMVRAAMGVLGVQVGGVAAPGDIIHIADRSAPAAVELLLKAILEKDRDRFQDPVVRHS